MISAAFDLHLNKRNIKEPKHGKTLEIYHLFCFPLLLRVRHLDDVPHFFPFRFAHNTTERGADIARPTDRATERATARPTPYVGENDALSSQGGGGRAAKKRSDQGMTRDAST